MGIPSAYFHIAIPPALFNMRRTAVYSRFHPPEINPSCHPLCVHGMQNGFHHCVFDTIDFAVGHLEYERYSEADRIADRTFSESQYRNKHVASCSERLEREYRQVCEASISLHPSSVHLIRNISDLCPCLTCQLSGVRVGNISHQTPKE